MVRRQTARSSIDRLERMLAGTRPDDVPAAGASPRLPGPQSHGDSDGWLPTEDALFDERPRLPRALARRSRRDGVVDPARSPRQGRHRGGADAAVRVRPHTPLFCPPSTLRGAEVRPSTSAVIGGIVVVLVAVLTFTVRVWWTDRSAAPHPVQVAAAGGGGTPLTAQRGGAVGSTTATSNTAPGVGGAAGSASALATIVGSATALKVHVVGRVRQPGVVAVASGARVQDVLAQAGGALADADLTQVNLARPVVDGEQIRVPRPGETLPAPAAQPAGAGSGPAPGGSPAGGAVNLNTATAADLDTLPGVGPVLAQRILEWRTTNGRFTSVDELGEVSGIGDKLMGQLRPHVTV